MFLHDKKDEPPASWYVNYRNLPPEKKVYWGGYGKSDYSIVTQRKDHCEISIKYKGTDEWPLDVDVRYVLRKGDSGFYVYVLASKPETTRDFTHRALSSSSFSGY